MTGLRFAGFGSCIRAYLQVPAFLREGQASGSVARSYTTDLWRMLQPAEFPYVGGRALSPKKKAYLLTAIASVLGGLSVPTGQIPLFDAGAACNAGHAAGYALATGGIIARLPGRISWRCTGGLERKH